MALKFADRVAESTISTGTGDVNLAGAIDTDHAAFGSQFADGDQMPVSVFGGGKWMTFVGQYNLGANSISRVTFRRSSTGSNLSLSGTMTVLCGWGADDGAAMVRTDVPQALASSKQVVARQNVGIDVATLSKSANYTAVAADYGALIKLTGSATLALTAAATLGDGWKCDIRNTSTGVWTIDPNGSEPVNGLATFNVYPGENFRLVCDGAGFFTVGTGTGLVMLDEKVASASATIDFTRFDAARFLSYRFTFNSILPATAGQDFWLRGSSDGGATFIAGGFYTWDYGIILSPSTLAGSGSNSDTKSILAANIDSVASGALSGSIEILPAGSYTTYISQALSSDPSSGAQRYNYGAGRPAFLMNGARFMMSSGNITSGSIKMYGVSK